MFASTKTGRHVFNFQVTPRDTTEKLEGDHIFPEQKHPEARHFGMNQDE